MRYFESYADLCAFCKNTGADKGLRKKCNVWLCGSWSKVWSLPK
jgi:hypothetical protein